MLSKDVIECGQALLHKNWTIAFVETVTAGKLTYTFSLVPKSNVFLVGGMICFNDASKIELLNVPIAILDKENESSDLSKALARGLSGYLESDICVSVTGILNGLYKDAPVGMLFFHIIFPHKSLNFSTIFKGSHEKIVDQDIDKVARRICDELKALEANEKKIPPMLL